MTYISDTDIEEKDALMSVILPQKECSQSGLLKRGLWLQDFWLKPKQQSLLVHFNDPGSRNEGLNLLCGPEI